MKRLLNTITKALRPWHRIFAATLPLRARRQYLYTSNFRRLGRFDSPRTFNEKVNWRILYDRRPEIGVACDKLAMKRAARLRVPEDRLRIPQTYWSGDDVTKIDWSRVPADWVLKPNHGSGNVLFSPSQVGQLPALTGGWLNDDQHEQLGEWGYSRAAKVFVLEERVPSSAGQAPVDYKFFCFDGEPAVIQNNVARFEDHAVNYYDLEWNRIPVRTKCLDTPYNPPPPRLLKDMISLARELSAGWDFMRVDLYVSGEDVWFGEYSPYPSGGVVKFRPHSFDVELGRRWRLPELVPPSTSRKTST